MTPDLSEVEFVSYYSKLSKLLVGVVLRNSCEINELAQRYAPGPYRAYLIEGQDIDDGIWVKLAIKFDDPTSEETLLWRLKWL